MGKTVYEYKRMLIVMELRKYRWSKDYESAEEELITLLKVRNINAERWVADEGSHIAAIQIEGDKRLWCAEGSLTVTVGAKRFSLQPGDTLDIPGKSVVEIQAGIAGCVCYEQKSS